MEGMIENILEIVLAVCGGALILALTIAIVVTLLRLVLGDDI